MNISEIFTSIQGESSYAGLPCTFIRFAGCNIKCIYCDTLYARQGEIELSEDEIINEVSLVGVQLVELTGGEPLMQDGSIHLIQRLANEGHHVLLETNGTMSIKDVDERATVIMDIKCPNSGMADSFDMTNLDYIKRSDEIKFVIMDRNDYEWACEMIDMYHLRQKAHMLFSPAFGYLSPESLAGWILEDRMDVRLNLQIHRYIWSSKESMKGL